MEDRILMLCAIWHHLYKKRQKHPWWSDTFIVQDSLAEEKKKIIGYFWET